VNTNDRIIAALTPGSIFNRNGHVWRSLNSLTQFADLELGALIDVLNGDLSGLVTCKPSTADKGILVALTENLTPTVPDETVEAVQVALAPDQVVEMEVTEIEGGPDADAITGHGGLAEMAENDEPAPA
jgi:hypothetical protein